MFNMTKRFAERMKDEVFANAFRAKQLREDVTDKIRDAYIQNTIALYAEIAFSLHEADYMVIVQVAKLVTNNTHFSCFKGNVHRILDGDADDIAYATKHGIFNFDTSTQAHADVFKKLESNFDLVAETIIDMDALLFDDEYIIKRLRELGGVF